MNKIIRKINSAVHIVLMAPIKLPVKELNIVKYTALGLGVLETILDKEEKSDDKTKKKEVADEESE